jgi:hypothetical protein
MTKLTIDYNESAGSLRVNEAEVDDFTVALTYDSVPSGDPGDNGDNGDNDDTGSTGDTGDSGSTGDTGETGDTGSTGDSGDSGDSGSTGDTGTSGDPGKGTEPPPPPPVSVPATAVGLNGAAGLQADVDFTLDHSKAWAFGGWYKQDSTSQSAAFVSTANHNNCALEITSYNGDKIVLYFQNGSAQLANKKLSSTGIATDWFFAVVANKPSDGKVTVRLAKYGDAIDALYADSAAFAKDIDVNKWAIGNNIGPGSHGHSNYLTGAVQEQFVFMDQAIADADIVAIANGDKVVSDLGDPRHYWELTDPSDLSGGGTVAAKLTAAGGKLSQVDGPTFTADGGTGGSDDPGGPGGSKGPGDDNGSGHGSNPGSSGGTGTNPPKKTGVALKEATLVAGATGKPVTVTAKQKMADGSHKTWKASVDPGKIARLHDGDTLSAITVNHIPEGGVTIGNDIADTTADVVLSSLIVHDPDGHKLHDGELTIYPYTHTRPFWYKTPEVIRKPKLHLLPDWNKGGHSSVASAYHGKDKAKDKRGNDLNGPMGSGLIQTATGTTGDRMDIGPLPEWDVAYLVNPSAENARVVRGMADAMATYPLHVRDAETLKMLSIDKYPQASIDYRFTGKSNNPIKKAQSSTPWKTTQQSAHMAGFMILSTLIFDTSYDREELAMNANYCELADVPTKHYRNGADVEIWGQFQTRGKAWTLRQVGAAANLVPEWSGYFNRWMDHADVYVRKHFSDPKGLPADWFDFRAGISFAMPNYMNHYLIMGAYMAYQMGCKQMKYHLDYFGRLPVQQMLDAPHEVADWYHPRGKYQGKIAKSWSDVLKITAEGGASKGLTSPGKIKAALHCKEGSAEMQAAIHGKNWQKKYKLGDFTRSPTSAANGAAYVLCTLACMRQYDGIDRIDAAATKAQKYERVDWGSASRYYIALS